MDLEQVWDTFIHNLLLSTMIKKAVWKKIAGIPFLYIHTESNGVQNEIEREIIKCSALSMKGKRLKSETIFVRKEENLLVFRHRFYLPQKKMFCCGNLCIDCTRLK